jgi:hypothetical protein
MQSFNFVVKFVALKNSTTVPYSEPSVIDGEYLNPLGDLQSFENEWLEVEVRHPTGWRQAVPLSPSSETPSTNATPKFLCTVLEEMCQEDGEGDRDWTG